QGCKPGVAGGDGFVERPDMNRKAITEQRSRGLQTAGHIAPYAMFDADDEMLFAIEHRTNAPMLVMLQRAASRKGGYEIGSGGGGGLRAHEGTCSAVHRTALSGGGIWSMWMGAPVCVRR